MVRGVSVVSIILRISGGCLLMKKEKKLFGGGMVKLSYHVTFFFYIYDKGCSGHGVLTGFRSPHRDFQFLFLFALKIL